MIFLGSEFHTFDAEAENDSSKREVAFQVQASMNRKYMYTRV